MLFYQATTIHLTPPTLDADVMYYMGVCERVTGVHVLCLQEVASVEMKCRFLHLFIMNGASLTSHIPEPRQYWENYPHR